MNSEARVNSPLQFKQVQEKDECISIKIKIDACCNAHVSAHYSIGQEIIWHILEPKSAS